MNTADMTGLLGFGTLAVALLIAIVLWVRFMRNPKNRHPMDGQRERNIQEIREESGEHPRDAADQLRH